MTSWLRCCYYFGGFSLEPVWNSHFICFFLSSPKVDQESVLLAQTLVRFIFPKAKHALTKTNEFCFLVGNPWNWKKRSQRTSKNPISFSFRWPWPYNWYCFLYIKTKTQGDQATFLNCMLHPQAYFLLFSGNFMIGTMVRFTLIFQRYLSKRNN